MPNAPAIIRWDQAYNRNGESKLPRAVVNAIRTHVDNHTLTGWVKAKTLADYTGLQERAVRAQISTNVKAGWLEVVESGNSSGKANIYRLTYPNHAVHDTVQPEKHVVDDMGNMSSDAGNHVVHDTPTTPRTSPDSSPKRRTTPEKGVVDDTIPADPFGSGDTDLPATTTTESNHVVHDTIADGAPGDTLKGRRRPQPWEEMPWFPEPQAKPKLSGRTVIPVGADPFAD